MFKTPRLATSKPATNGAAPGSHFVTPASPPATIEPPAPPTAGEELTALKKQLLGRFDRYVVDHQARTNARVIVGELVVNMLAAQRDVILHRILLGVAREKRQALVEALREDGKLDREITKLSTEYERELLDFIQDRALDTWERQRARLDQLDAARDAGKITEAAHAAECASIERNATTARANLDGRLELLLRNHFAQIERTLQLFVEQRLRIEKI